MTTSTNQNEESKLEFRETEEKAKLLQKRISDALIQMRQNRRKN